MARLTGRTTWQTVIMLLLMLIGTSSVAQTPTMTAQQRLLRSMKSGNQAGVWAALNELSHKAIQNGQTTRVPVADSASQANESGDGHGSKIITIDYPGAAETLLVAINNAGVIIGYYADSAGTVGSFLREPDGTFVPVDPPGAGIGPNLGTIIWSVNEAGSVTGTLVDQAGGGHGYLRTHDGKYTQIDVEGAGPVCCTLGLNINEDDTVAGGYIDSANVEHGYLRFVDGTVETFSIPGAGSTGYQPGTSTDSVDGLNPKGDVAGNYFDGMNVEHGFFRFRDGVIVLIDVDGAGTALYQGTNTVGINDRLEIPGNYIDQNGVNHGFVRFANGFTEKFDLPTAGTASGQGTVPQNINCEGDIIGYYIDTTNTSHGFLRYADGRVTTFELPSATNLFPYNNNQMNAIVGYYLDANNNLHGFLRTP